MKYWFETISLNLLRSIYCTQSTMNVVLRYLYKISPSLYFALSVEVNCMLPRSKSQLVSQSEFFGFLFLKCGIYFHFIKLWKSAMICSRVAPIVWQPWWALMEKSPQLLFGIVVMHSFRPTEISVGLLPFAKALSKWHWIENICELSQKLQCF